METRKRGSGLAYPVPRPEWSASTGVTVLDHWGFLRADDRLGPIEVAGCSRDEWMRPGEDGEGLQAVVWQGSWLLVHYGRVRTGVHSRVKF